MSETLQKTESSINRLRELTEKLTNFENYADNSNCSMTEIKMVEGTGLGFCLLNQPEIAVARWFSSKGSEFPKHKHEEREWIIVYKGEMELFFYDEEGNISEQLKLEEGDYCYNSPGKTHSAIFNSDTWYIAITVPASKDWPNDKRNKRS